MHSMKNYIINPKTNNPIKIGGRIYNKLINDGVFAIKEDNKSKKVLFRIEKDNTRKVEDIKKELTESEDFNNDDFTIVKGKGILQDNLVKQRKRLNRIDFVNQLTNVLFNILQEDDDLIEHLRGMKIDELKEEITNIIIG